MFPFLKNHPFAVEAFFKCSIVVTFAFPKDKLEHLIPECLDLDLYNDKWAFVAVALVQTQNLRPKGFPLILGSDFMLIGYRIFVRYTNNAGKRLRGLYILKTETDKKTMALLGNVFTHYNYAQTDINLLQQNTQLNVVSNQSNFSLQLEIGDGEIKLPASSPFASWKEARRFAGPFPHTFAYSKPTQKVLIIEGMRENWIPKPIEVIDFHVPFFNSIGLSEGVLANAFIIHDVPYCWKKGKIETWNQ